MDNVSNVLLINSDNEILLILRDNKPDIAFPNTWCPPGGHFENRETPLECLKREVIEEINLVLDDAVLIGTFDDKIGNLVHVHKARIDKKISELTLNEGQRLGYFSFDELINLEMPPALKEFIQQNRNIISI